MDQQYAFNNLEKERQNGGLFIIHANQGQGERVRHPGQANENTNHKARYYCTAAVVVGP